MKLPLTCRGFWALAAVLPWAALAGNIQVPNGSFESPAVGEPFYGGPIIDSWEKTPEPPGYDTNLFGPWFEKTGVFFNFPSPIPIEGMDGLQGAFLFSFPGAGFFQDYDSVGGTNAGPSNEFEAIFQVGKGYRLRAGLTTSSTFPLAEGATLLMRVYYRDANSNRLTVAQSTVTYSTNVFTDPYRLTEVELLVPVVQPGDPWAGKRIGIEFVSTAAPQFIGGVWDLDNVRVADFEWLLLDPQWTVGPQSQFQFTLLGPVGGVAEILRNTEVALPPGLWPVIGHVTNTTGVGVFVDPAAGGSQAFYLVRQRP